MIKVLLRAVAFCLIFLVILSALSALFIPKGNDPDSGIHDIRQHGILGEPAHSIDVLIIGDSLAQCGFSPLDIWAEFGITSHSCASGMQKLYLTREYIGEVFSVQSPRVVLLEANTILAGIGFVEELTHGVQKAIPAFRYHDRWKNLNWSDFSSHVEYTHRDTLKGYHYEDGVEASYDLDYMTYTEKHASIPDRNREYLQDIMQLCNENGAQLILVSVPSTYNWDYARHNALEALAAEMGLLFWDMNQVPEIGISWDEDTYDGGNHMNYSGAYKNSLYIGELLTQTGLFTDKRQDSAYSAWYEDLAEFRDQYGN